MGSDQVRSGQVRSGQVRSGQVRSGDEQEFIRIQQNTAKYREALILDQLGAKGGLLAGRLTPQGDLIGQVDLASRVRLPPLV